MNDLNKSFESTENYSEKRRGIVVKVKKVCSDTKPQPLEQWRLVQIIT